MRVNRLARQAFPSVKRLEKDRKALASEYRRLAAFVDRQPNVLQYRRAYFETNGVAAPGDGLPCARHWPDGGGLLSYREKLIGRLPYGDGRGAEIGPLNIPLLSKRDADVLYVDHLDTAGLRDKYKHLSDIAGIDRPMINDSIADTLAKDAPLDYLVASQVMEHVPNPIRWMSEIAAVLRVGGILAISLPDRRATFDFYREETRASDWIATYLQDLTLPDVRAVYDHHSQATAVNMHWAIPKGSATPDEIVRGRGAVRPIVVAADAMALTRAAQSGQYLDVHCWVFTPPSFLLAMAQIAAEGLLSFRCKQFYPTALSSEDRDNHSFVAILEKSDAAKEDIRRSFLEALGPERDA